ncbi:MAG: hypothetical protein AB8F74_11340, partial [Saprospiraceae bacterium]
MSLISAASGSYKAFKNQQQNTPPTTPPQKYPVPKLMNLWLLIFLRKVFNQIQQPLSPTIGRRPNGL